MTWTSVVLCMSLIVSGLLGYCAGRVDGNRRHRSREQAIQTQAYLNGRNSIMDAQNAIMIPPDELWFLHNTDIIVTNPPTDPPTERKETP